MGAVSFDNPFTVRVLDARLVQPAAEPEPEPELEPELEREDMMEDMLPATYRTNNDSVVEPQAGLEFLEKELLVPKLQKIQDWLWVCGRLMPPRPLHHQVLISRDIVITENPELHLIWCKNRIFIKPIPTYLLEPDFWTTHMLHDSPRHRQLTACARGFLFSYTALIAYESDFRIALGKGLLPHQVTWTSWKALCRQILKSHDFNSVNARYWYGELRLGRLNQVYRCREGHFLRGYSRVAAHPDYTDLLRDNFGALAAILAYAVVALSAMQVGLGTERLQTDETFQNASYGFTVFSIVAPLIATAGIMAFFVALLASNWVATRNFEKRRLAEMKVRF